MAIGSVDTLPLPPQGQAQTPALTPTASQSQKKRAPIDQDISERGLRQAELTDYQDAAAAQDGDDEGLSFWDVLDVVNPLQHIPIVNTIYRELTGDKISSGAKLAGGTLFFGPIGLGFAALDVGVKEMTGASIDEHVVAMIKGEDAGENARQLAAAETADKAAKTAAANPAAVSGAALSGAASPGSTAASAAAGAGAVQAAPVASVDRNAPLGLFDGAAAAAPAAATSASGGAGQPVGATVAVAPLGLIGATPPIPAAASHATAAKIAQEAENRPRTLESTRPRGRLARSAQPSPDHLAMAMQAQGLEPSKLMAVPSRSATAVSAQMIAAEKQGQVQTASTPAQRGQAGGAASGAPGTAQDGGPVDMPAWFDSAMMKASSAYQKTNRITSAP